LLTRLLCRLQILFSLSALLRFFLPLSFGFGGTGAGLFDALPLAFLRLCYRLLLATAQSNHARVLCILCSVARGRFHRLPLLTPVVVFGAVERCLCFGDRVSRVLIGACRLR